MRKKFDEYKHLKKMVGKDAYRALTERGAFLRIWRNTTPYNYWVEGRSGRTYWHSQNEGPNRFSRPHLSLFIKVEESKQKVYDFLSGPTGKPVSSTYLLRKKK